MRLPKLERELENMEPKEALSETLRAQIDDYNRRALATLKEIKGFGIITTDLVLWDGLKALADKNNLEMDLSKYWLVHNKTQTWNNLGNTRYLGHYDTSRDSCGSELSPVLESVHEPIAGVWSCSRTVGELVKLANSKFKEGYDLLSITCNLNLEREIRVNSVIYWMAKGKLSLRLVKGAATALPDYETGLECFIE